MHKGPSLSENRLLLIKQNCSYHGGDGLVAKTCPTLTAPWTIALQAPLSLRFPKQEYWSGLPFPSAGDLPDPGVKPQSPVWQADPLPFEPPGKDYMLPNNALEVLK